jgi:hypothetical protein
LPDYVQVEEVFDLFGAGALDTFVRLVLAQNFIAERDAPVANEDLGTTDELSYLALSLSAERTREVLASFAWPSHVGDSWAYAPKPWLL